MHTTRTVSKNHSAIYAKHNSDHSGPIEVEWRTVSTGQWKSATIPGEVFIALAKEFLYQEIREKVEHAMEAIWD